MTDKPIRHQPHEADDQP